MHLHTLRCQCIPVMDVLSCDNGSVYLGDLALSRRLLVGQAASVSAWCSTSEWAQHHRSTSLTASICLKMVDKEGASPGIEPGASRTRSENHTLDHEATPVICAATAHTLFSNHVLRTKRMLAPVILRYTMHFRSLRCQRIPVMDVLS